MVDKKVEPSQLAKDAIREIKEIEARNKALNECYECTGMLIDKGNHVLCSKCGNEYAKKGAYYG